MPRYDRDVSRRTLLKFGALGTSVSLASQLRLPGGGAVLRPKRSGIFVFLEGGPSHLDTFDPKPEAPSDIRGEFSRTPKINKACGRDHWARAMCALMAGGGVRGGQVLGATDATGAEPRSAGYRPDDLAASFFANLGIDPRKEFQTDVGRPITLVRDGRPIDGLF